MPGGTDSGFGKEPRRNPKTMLLGHLAGGRGAVETLPAAAACRGSLACPETGHPPASGPQGRLIAERRRAARALASSEIASAGI